MASYTPGTYEGAARGYGGKLFVRVTVSEDRIEAVTVTQHKEYRGIAWGLNTTPIERYPELIVEYQTLNIPVVDGADLTCAAILDATAAALKAAPASTSHTECCLRNSVEIQMAIAASALAICQPRP